MLEAEHTTQTEQEIQTVHHLVTIVVPVEDAVLTETINTQAACLELVLEAI